MANHHCDKTIKVPVYARDRPFYCEKCKVYHSGCYVFQCSRCGRFMCPFRWHGMSDESKRIRECWRKEYD